MNQPSQFPRWRGPLRLLFVCLFAVFGSKAHADGPPQPLFNGRSLEGWTVPPQDQKWWRVEKGLLCGGSLTEKIPHNTFAATAESFENFELTLQIRIRGNGGFINSGIQIRSQRMPNSSEMIGYQVDAGDGWWGKLYDESRRRQVLAEPVDPKAIQQAVHRDGWNTYKIRAEGRRIRSWINGVPALDYTETDPDIPLDGHLGFQVHGGGKALVEFKDILLKRLPPTPNAMTWSQLKSKSAREPNPSQEQPPSAPLSPEDERKTFRLPEGFEVELVASESEETGKFVGLAFDARGRLWTMTALEYPVDANEAPEASRELFARGGRDKVLTIDRYWEKNPPAPKTFVDGLVMPLGVLPYREGVYVQYGPDIRFYKDSDHDGRADHVEVVLTGFGTQDSHLFPHQFTRVPGGGVLAAQGLFNDSTVRRPNGQAFASGDDSIPFRHCKLACFSFDGSRFELLTAGPNNIWGLARSREGEIWIQEANDMGYPIIPFEPGQRYRTGSTDRLRPFQPLMPPPLFPPQMGGTGLSGLCLAEDGESPFAEPLPGDPKVPPRDETKTTSAPAKIFYVANPITSRIQRIRAIPDGKRYRYEKLPDFLISDDTRFRPVALEFGPDGCLYVVDWYNKIISHNEVPRSHPERDKTRGRIWRIRPSGQPHVAPPNLYEETPQQLLTRLGDANAKVATLAWQTIIDRQLTELVAPLSKQVRDASLPAGARLGALWALEGLTTVPTELLQALAREENPNIRHESIRIAAAQPRPLPEFLMIAQPLAQDPSPKVRAALGDALRHLSPVDVRAIELMAALGRAPLRGNSWERYDRDFERYLALWAMQKSPAVVSSFLASPQGQRMPLENKVLATRALPPAQAAVGLARLLPALERKLTEEELALLLTSVTNPEVAGALDRLLGSAASRPSILRMLLELRTSIDAHPLLPAITAAARAIWDSSSDPEDVKLVLTLAGAFRLSSLDESIAQYVANPKTPEPMRLLALRSLRELGSHQASTLAGLMASPTSTPAVREAALHALAQSPSPQTLAVLSEQLSRLNYRERRTAVDHLSTSRQGCLALLEALSSGDLEEEALDAAAIDRMQQLLGDRPELRELADRALQSTQRILQLNGNADDYVRKSIDLDGPFTIESWVRLASGISNGDSLLGRPGVADVNFHQSKLRVWLGNGKHDVVVADRPVKAEVWTHVAVTRDASGTFRLYINGEPAGTSPRSDTTKLAGLRIGQSAASGKGTQAHFDEVRIWDGARTPEEIRTSFDRRFAEASRPKELVTYLHGEDWGELSGRARVIPSKDVPSLLSDAQFQAQIERFDRYRSLAQRNGDRVSGKAIFTKTCLVCHQQAGKGGAVGPALDGIGVNGIESLLRHILTPSAAIEGGYRNFVVLTTDGRVVDGLLVSEDAASVVLRKPNTADIQISTDEIEQAGFSKRSVMPDGLLDNLTDQEVSNLFAYLLSLNVTSSQPR